MSDDDLNERIAADCRRQDAEVGGLLAFVTARLRDDETAGGRTTDETSIFRSVLEHHWPVMGGDDCEEYQRWPCMTLRLIASIWSKHPDYLDRWHPDKGQSR